jgi:acetyl-CoA acetyltransferase
VEKDMDNIAIVGVAQTKYERRKKDKTYYDLVFEMTKGVLEDSGLTLEDIDNVITVSNDFLDGRTISSMAVGEAAGAWDKNIFFSASWVWRLSRHRHYRLTPTWTVMAFGKKASLRSL